MMLFLIYNALLWTGLILASPLIGFYLAYSDKARTGLSQKLGFYPKVFLEKLQIMNQKDKPIIWLHAVSVGEFNAVRTLVNRLMPDYHIVLSTTTRTGQALAKQTYPDIPIFYFPFDLKPVIQRALQAIRPDLVVLTETEIWPNFIDSVRRNANIPLILINGRISTRSFNGYRRIPLIIQPTLRRISHFYMQSQRDAERIELLGASREQVTVAGNIKFDLNAMVDPMQKTILRHLFGFSALDKIITVASTHSGEDLPMIEMYQHMRKDFPEIKLILAPRHPERVPEIRKFLHARGLTYNLRTQLSESHPNVENIIILDTIGELLTVYSLSAVAIVCGSFVARGGHNLLEPMSQGIPVIFGPYMDNFRDMAQMVLEYHAGFQVQTPEEVNHALTELLTQPEVYSNVVENGQRLLENNRGTKEVLEKAIRYYLTERKVLQTSAG